MSDPIYTKGMRVKAHFTFYITPKEQVKKGSKGTVVEDQFIRRDLLSLNKMMVQVRWDDGRDLVVQAILLEPTL